MGRPPISASGRCPAFPQEGCVTSPWANPKRQPLYHKFTKQEASKRSDAAHGSQNMPCYSPYQARHLGGVSRLARRNRPLRPLPRSAPCGSFGVRATRSGNLTTSSRRISNDFREDHPQFTAALSAHPCVRRGLSLPYWSRRPTGGGYAQTRFHLTPSETAAILAESAAP